MASKVKMEVNLSKLARSQIKETKVARAIIPILRRDAFKREVANRFIDEIVKRTQKENIDKDGNNFKKYSKSYVQSEVFKIYGKSKGDVNLTLSGEMLAAMAVKNLSGVDFEIYFTSKTQNDKAHGHINGIPSKAEGTVVRDFFGLPEDVQGEILKKTLTDYNLNPDSFDRLESLNAEELAQAIAERVNTE